MRDGNRPLTLATWLTSIRDHGLGAEAHLGASGFHPNVIRAKAEKASRRGYTDFGTTPTFAWLTEKGWLYLATNTEEHDR